MKKVIIEIPDVMYDWIDNGFPDEDDYAKLWELIRQGTPLPKGHGDLIDRSKVIKSLFNYHNGKKTIGQCIDDVPTIIKADKGE